MIKIYHATAETFPTAHSMESAEQSPLSTKHLSVLPTHPPNITLAAVTCCCETEFRPAFTTTGNLLITKIKQTLQNFLKQYGSIKTNESNHG